MTEMKNNASCPVRNTSSGATTFVPLPMRSLPARIITTGTSVSER